MVLENNLRGLFNKFGVDYTSILSEFNVNDVYELSIFDLQTIAQEYEVDLQAMLFKPLFCPPDLRKKLAQIQLLVLDVDGVMTDGGMYFTENGDQFKKFNTKDGMGIINLTRKNFNVAIISSGFVNKAVQQRAKLLGIQHCIVSRGNKLEILNELLDDLNINYKNVAMIGDDINDLEVMKKIAIAACPKDAVTEVKKYAHIILNALGGCGCVREFIDNYLNNVQNESYKS